MTTQLEESNNRQLDHDQSVAHHEQRVRCLELRKAGYSYEYIAKAENIKSRAGALRAVTRLLDGRGEESGECTRRIELERLNSLLTALWPKANQGDLEAIDRILAVHQRICMLVGLEGPLARPHQVEPAGAPEFGSQLLQEPSKMRSSVAPRSEPTAALPTSTKTLPAPPARPQKKPAVSTTSFTTVIGEAVSRINRNYWIALAACVLILLLTFSLGRSPSRSPEYLASRALSAAEASQRVEAATLLAMVSHPDPTPFLRNVAEKSQDADVLVQVLTGLTARADYANLPLFCTALENPAVPVQAAAWAGIQRIYNEGLPERLEYKVDGPAEERVRVARRLKEIYEEKLTKFKGVKA